MTTTNIEEIKNLTNFSCVSSLESNICENQDITLQHNDENVIKIMDEKKKLLSYCEDNLWIVELGRRRRRESFEFAEFSEYEKLALVSGKWRVAKRWSPEFWVWFSLPLHPGWEEWLHHNERTWLDVHFYDDAKRIYLPPRPSKEDTEVWQDYRKRRDVRLEEWRTAQSSSYFYDPQLGSRVQRRITPLDFHAWQAEQHFLEGHEWISRAIIFTEWTDYELEELEDIWTDHIYASNKEEQKLRLKPIEAQQLTRPDGRVVDLVGKIDISQEEEEEEDPEEEEEDPEEILRNTLATNIANQVTMPILNEPGWEDEISPELTETISSTNLTIYTTHREPRITNLERQRLIQEYEAENWSEEEQEQLVRANTVKRPLREYYSAVDQIINFSAARRDGWGIERFYEEQLNKVENRNAAISKLIATDSPFAFEDERAARLFYEKHLRTELYDSDDDDEPEHTYDEPGLEAEKELFDRALFFVQKDYRCYEFYVRTGQELLRQTQADFEESSDQLKTTEQDLTKYLKKAQRELSFLAHVIALYDKIAVRAVWFQERRNERQKAGVTIAFRPNTLLNIQHVINEHNYFFWLADERGKYLIAQAFKKFDAQRARIHVARQLQYEWIEATRHIRTRQKYLNALDFKSYVNRSRLKEHWRTYKTHQLKLTKNETQEKKKLRDEKKLAKLSLQQEKKKLRDEKKLAKLSLQQEKKKLRDEKKLAKLSLQQEKKKLRDEKKLAKEKNVL